MAEIRATPQNKVLAGLATALANTRSFLNPAPGTPLHGVSWFRPGDFLMGKAPEEVTEWSYGNAPFQIPPMSRIPQAKQLTTEAPDGAKETVSRALSSMDALLAAPTEIAARGAAVGAPLMVGAVRKGGLPNLVATHATSAAPSSIEKMTEKGLYAPSIGLHGPGRNDYSGKSAQIVWNAGALDRDFGGMPSQIFNRDAYVWNPSPLSQLSMEDQYKMAGVGSLEKALADLMGDSRLTQMLPDRWSQTAAILASPRFKNLERWENSMYGAGALRQNSAEVENYKYAFNEMAGRRGWAEGTQKTIDLLQTIGKLSRADIDPGMVEGSAAGDMYSLARNAPSMMGEMKVYAPSVQMDPTNAVVYAPRTMSSKVAEQAFEDLGFRVYDDRHLRALDYLTSGKFLSSEYPHRETPLYKLAPPDGGMPPSPEQLLEIFNNQSGVSTRKAWQGYDLPTFGGSVPKVKAPVDEDFSVDDFIDEMASIYGEDAIFTPSFGGFGKTPKPNFESALNDEHLAQWKAIQSQKAAKAPPEALPDLFPDMDSLPDPDTDPGAVWAQSLPKTEFTKQTAPEPTSGSYPQIIKETSELYGLPQDVAKQVVNTWMDTGNMFFYEALNKTLKLDKKAPSIPQVGAASIKELEDYVMSDSGTFFYNMLQVGIPESHAGVIYSKWLNSDDHFEPIFKSYLYGELPITPDKPYKKLTPDLFKGPAE